MGILYNYYYVSVIITENVKSLKLFNMGTGLDKLQLNIINSMINVCKHGNLYEHKY